MFRKALFTFSLCLALMTGACAQNTLKKAHDSSHSIFMATIANEAGCSATAIAPHAASTSHSLLTATHCELGSDDVLIDRNIPAHILGRIRDGNDHTIFITDVEFKTYVELSDRELVQGDTVFVFGNPGAMVDILRYGTFSGVIRPSFFGPPMNRLMFDFNVFHGDSGAALFDAVTGKVAGVITGVLILGESPDTMKLTYAWPLAFTKAQLQQLK